MSLVLASLMFLQQAAPAAAATPPSPCASEAHAAFDFWVGNWDVYQTGTQTKVAESRIERLHNGCVVREHWQPASPAGGSSLNTLDPVSGRWHQSWTGAAGETVQFEGGPVGGQMVLTGYWNNYGGAGQHALVRMTYTANPDGSVRQHGETSADHGLTWATGFDFTYRPRAG